MTTITTTFTRKSTTDSFYVDTAFNDHLNDVYILTGKLHVAVNTSGLIRTVTMSGTDAAIAEFEADPVVTSYISARNAYDTSKEITASASSDAS